LSAADQAVIIKFDFMEYSKKNAVKLIELCQGDVKTLKNMMIYRYYFDRMMSYENLDNIFTQINSEYFTDGKKIQKSHYTILIESYLISCHYKRIKEGFQDQRALNENERAIANNYLKKGFKDWVSISNSQKSEDESNNIRKTMLNSETAFVNGIYRKLGFSFKGTKPLDQGKQKLYRTTIETPTIDLIRTTITDYHSSGKELIPDSKLIDFLKDIL